LPAIQEAFIVKEWTFKSWYGWGWWVKWTRLNGGRKQERNELIPIMTDKNTAPDELLKIIHCNCSRDYKSARCSCRRYGLPCTAACGPCQVENFDNLNSTQEVDTEEEEAEHGTKKMNLLRIHVHGLTLNSIDEERCFEIVTVDC
jgi:hypothetical protein